MTRRRVGILGLALGTLLGAVAWSAGAPGGGVPATAPAPPRPLRPGAARPTTPPATRPAPGSATIRPATTRPATTRPASPKFVTTGPPITLTSDVMPVLTRLGCAAASCHGGAGGKGGLHLSLFGADPQADRDAIVTGGEGRRANFAEARQSLLLLKVTAAVAHGGERRVAPASPEYELLAGWLARGAPLTDPRQPALVSVKASAAQLTLKPGDQQALRITAGFADATQRDVTGLALFRSLDATVAAVDSAGVVKAQGHGQTCVIATYRRRSVVVRVVVPLPLSAPLPSLSPANRVDELVGAKLKELGLPPSEPCADHVFLRRVYLDAIGTLPTPAEARQFLADRDPDKRRKLIDQLLERDEFAHYGALKWGDLLRIKSEYPVRVWPKGVQTYYRWLHDSLAHNKPYDQLVTELLTSSGSNFRDGPANFFRAVPSKDPQSFGDNVALLFMGARLGCARCHGHPYENWGLDDSLGMAAFFGKMKFKATGEWKEEIVYVDPEAGLRHPKTKEPVQPRFLGGPATQPARDADPRPQFAAWLTAPDNPWFARNAVNRIWFWLLGRGIVHEPDDLRPTNPPNNPDLLDYLASELVRSKYDTKHIYRLILNSRTYQLSSQPNAGNVHDAVHFSHYPVKRLEAEPLLDAISQVTQTTETYTSTIPEPYTKLLDQRAVDLSDGSIGNAFLEMFGRPPRDTPYESERCSQASMRQILHLLNSSDIDRKVAASNRVKRLVQENRTDQEVIEELVLAAFSRFPTDQERQKLLKLIAGKKPRAQAIQDLMWAILNSKEFAFNH